MKTSLWSKLRIEAGQRLTQACPLLADTASASRVDAMVTIVALSHVRLTASPMAGRVEAMLSATPTPRDDTMAQEILQRIANVVSEHAGRARPEATLKFGRWLDNHGLVELIADLLERGTEPPELTALTDIVGAAIRTLAERTKALCASHLEEILPRDIPHASFLSGGLTVAAEWLLAPELSGDACRPEVLTRRLQAMQVYGALSKTLAEPDITKAIDDGVPLAPLLMRWHDLTAAELRAFREARRLRYAIEHPGDFRVALEELKAHQVPLAQWPGEGKPGQADAWEGSVWVKGARQSLIRPDYVGAQADGVHDAMNALRDDLLRPLIAERLRAGRFMPTSRIESFVRSVELRASDGGGIERQRFLAAIRAAVVGPRRPKSFREAVALWHRRVASISALRHERRADRPGWPPLCAPWRSACGRFQIVVLTSAADLVDEGKMLDHCVGGYYEICRQGDTQILSMREKGVRVATVEIRLGSDIDAPTLQVGQFSARRNTSPSQHLHEPLREFLRAVRSGAHPMNTAKLARYRKRMKRTWDGGWSGNALPLEHSRDVFPLYLPLLPRGTPRTFDAWAEETGLAKAIDQTLSCLTDGPPARVDDHIPY